MFEISDTQSKLLPTPDFIRIHLKSRTHSIFSEIGVGLAGFGIAFVFLGVLLLFDKGLLAIGNVGVCLAIKSKSQCYNSFIFFACFRFYSYVVWRVS